MKAWHFVGKTLMDGSPIPADGVKLIHPGKPVLCERGLHASLHPFDALQYAPGETLCLVECGGTILHQNDKLVCNERTIITRMDTTPLLRHFARQQALSVIHLWKPPQIVLDYLMGDDSAWEAAREAAWDAARETARFSARDAAWSAARSAARGAARFSAREAAQSAARDDFQFLVNGAFEDWL